ncbi:MAG TPA: prepilin-type N-terminal cleavage/methylation domain-containing protein [Caulobacteraceae bacterium]|nr:prepilin-type N-terminal cleavage/methylation domain-containing protein [Caulobacteraceae bacterium]
MARSDRGFALVEMVAALALMAMLAWMLIAGAFVARSAWERLEARTAWAESIGGAQTVLRGRLESLYPATVWAAGQALVDFQGAPDRVAFLAPPPDQARPAPLRRYALGLDHRDELVLSSISDVASPTAVADAAVLLRGVEGLEIDYFGAAGPDDQPRWRRSWSDQPKPPELIRIRLTFPPGDRRYWPDLIVRPAATIDSDCVLNAFAGRCLGRA